MRRRNYRNIAIFGLGIFVAVFLFVFLAQKFGKMEDNTSAANLANFRAGHIISDFQMTDYTSMSEADISNFLWSKGRCYNTNFRDVGTRVDYFSDHTPPTTWHVVNGHTVCLAEENMNGESAAHIIWQAAQDYHINPKVLIVLIQKETGLITDPIPNSWDYQRAAGYGCPDTAACSEKYYGFKNQVRNAAYLFRIVMDGNSSHYPIGYNNVRYNPNPDCGSSVIYIENLATSALYRYTPYQPNAGALAAGYGTAPCGAYGNRNFYAYFEDWFGGANEERLTVGYSVKEKLSGYRTVVSDLADNKVIDISGGAGTAKNGTNIQLWESNNTEAQIWNFIYNSSDDTYKIVNPTTGRSLDVSSAGVADGTNIQLWDSHDSCAQKWRITEKRGTYIFTSACSDKVLDISAGRSDNGANIQLWRFNDSSAQKWKVSEVDFYKARTAKIEDDKYVIFSSLADNKVIDISGGAGTAKNGTNIQLWESNNTEAQVWKFTYNSADDTYSIINPATGRSLDVSSAGVADGTNIQLWESHDSCAQKWKLSKINDEYLILSACSGKGLDVSNANINSGTNIQLWSLNGNIAQRWKMKKAEDIKKAEEAKKAEAEKNAISGNHTIFSSLADNKVIDISGGAGTAKNGTNIQLWESNNTEAQVWKFTYNSADDTYSIINPATGRSLDVSSAGVADGTNIQLWESHDSCAQKWKLSKINDEYLILSACSGKGLDVSNANINSGTNIQLWSLNGSVAQKWKIK